jgi:septal ring factor EnvC (AmiA/AmiB activator)
MKKNLLYIVFVALVVVCVIVVENVHITTHYKKLLYSRTSQIEQLNDKLKEKEAFQIELENKVKKLESMLSKERRLRVKLEEATSLAKKLIAESIEKEEEIKRLRSQIRDLEVKVYDLEKLLTEERTLRMQLEKELSPKKEETEGEKKMELLPVLPEERIIEFEKK